MKWAFWRTPSTGGGPPPARVPPPADEHVLDRAWLGVVRDTVVDVVHEILAGDAAAVRTTTDLFRSRLSAGTPDQEGLTVIASLASLSVRLPARSGVTGAVHDDPDAMRLLLSYADLLAERAEPLRARTAPQISREQVRLAAHFACGAPDSDPALTPLTLSAAADQLLAAGVLLAQTCLDGGAGAQDIAREIDEGFPA